MIRTIAIPALFWLSLCCASRAAQPDLPFKTGAEFERQLAGEVLIELSNNPLRIALESLSRSQQVAVFLDRRVDPEQIVQLAAEYEPLERALDRLTQSLGLEWTTIGDVIYIGPAGATGKLGTLAELKNEEAAARPVDLARRLLSKQVWQWERLATPRELLQRLSREAGFQMQGLEKIPHDLWPAATLPPLTTPERLTLLLAGFDLSFELAATEPAVVLVPMPTEVVLTRSYPARGQGTIDRLRRLLPEVSMQARGGQVVVKGSLKQHQMVKRLLSGGAPQQPTAGRTEQRYSLVVNQASLRDVLAQLSQQWQLELEVDPQARALLQRMASLNVDDVTQEELLDRLLLPVGLKHRIDKGSLRIMVADRETELAPNRP